VRSDPLAPRLLCFHKQGTSARTRFVRWPHGMLAFAPLPGEAIPAEPSTLVIRPHATVMRAAAGRLGLAEGDLRVETDFVAAFAAPGGMLDIYLLQFATLDPPFAAVEALGGKFIAITEARDVAPAELQLLRQAYEILIG
jgi:hypothetical protein